MSLPPSPPLLPDEKVFGDKITILSEVLMGPLRDRTTVVVHLDDALPWVVQEAIMALEAVQETPHVTLSLGVNQPAPPFIHGGSFVLHLLLFLTDPTKLLQSLWPNWRPRYLLLFSLASSNSVATILNHEVFSKVSKLALMTELPNEVLGRPRTMGVYTFQPFSSSKPKFLGEWNPLHYKQRSWLFTDRFPSFDGYQFEVASWMNDPPFLYQRTSSSVVSRRGVMIHAVATLASALNFTYTLALRPPDMKWGSLVKGRWNGLLGQIFRGEKNFTISTLFVNAQRQQDFDASVSFITSGFGAFLQNPRPLPEWLNVQRPFQPFVWAAVTATLATAVWIMTVQTHLRLEPLKLLSSYSNTCTALLERVCGQPFVGGGVSTWLYLQRGMFGQGVPTIPQAMWQRMFIGVWYLYCLLVSIYYTSNLIAIFTNPAYPQHIHTLQQLADSDYRLAKLDNGDLLLLTLRESRDDIYQKLERKLDVFPEDDDAVASMLDGTHAFVHGAINGYIRLGVRYKVFNFYEVGERMLPGYLSWYFPKYVPWKYKFDQGIQAVLEAGLFEHWLKVEMDDLLGRRGDQHLMGEQTTMVLTLQHLQGLFYILILAWVASVAVFLLELLRPRCSHR
ncbi:glutamate receptor ionotropic, delta-2-like [Panulirus ornatus]|uniref:glutamate receptor ionotropic, delta-2-like n=1 Tax=Panulirus ornatus TaxID=150431 RepID=UPI003A85E6FE